MKDSHYPAPLDLEKMSSPVKVASHHVSPQVCLQPAGDRIYHSFGKYGMYLGTK